MPINALALSAEQTAQANAGFEALIPAGVQQGAVTSLIIPGVARVAVASSAVIPQVIAGAVITQQVIPVVVTEAIKTTQVFPQVAQGAIFQSVVMQAMAAGATQEQAEAQATAFVTTAEGQAQISGLLAAYSAAYEANQDAPAAPAGGPFSQAQFDAFTAAVADALANNPEVQAGIAGLTEAYTAAYLANPSAPVATAPFTQAQFDGLTGGVALGLSRPETQAGIAAFTQAYTAAYLASPGAPVATTGFSQEQFDGITAVVENELNSNPEAVAGIAGLTQAFTAAYLANPANPQATGPFSQAQFDQVLAGVQGQLALTSTQTLINEQIQALRDGGQFPTFQEGPNNFIIEDQTSLTGFRSIREGELITLTVPQDSIAIWLGRGQGIPDRFVLDADEIALIEARTAAFNSVIANAAAGSERIGLLDMNAIFDDFANNPTSQYRSLGGVDAQCWLHSSIWCVRP